MRLLRARILAFAAAARLHSRGEFVQSFQRDERGVVAAMFAIVFASVFLMAAIAIDYGRTEAELVRGQNAVDSAALAASHRLRPPGQGTPGPQKAEAYFKANIAKHADVGVLDSIKLDAAKGEVAAKAKGSLL